MSLKRKRQASGLRQSYGPKAFSPSCEAKRRKSLYHSEDENKKKCQWVPNGKLEPGLQGLFSTVVHACCDRKKTNCQYIAKVIPIYLSDSESFERQVQLQLKCAHHDLCPKILDTWICPQAGILIMQSKGKPLRNVLEHYRNNIPAIALFYILSCELIAQLHQIGIIHHDLHLGNILVEEEEEAKKKSLLQFAKETLWKKNYRLYLIDFTHSSFSQDVKQQEKDYYLFRKMFYNVILLQWGNTFENKWILFNIFKSYLDWKARHFSIKDMTKKILHPNFADQMRQFHNDVSSYTSLLHLTLQN